MLKRSFFVYAVAIIAVAAISVTTLALPAMAASFINLTESERTDTDPKLSPRTLTLDNITVSGKFEEDAVIIVKEVSDAENSIKELKDRKQISNEKQIVAIYDISVSGEHEAAPIYTVTIKNIKLNPLAKNKVSVIQPDGSYYAINGFNYNKNTIAFNTDTLGQIIVHKDTTLFYLVIGIVADIILLIIIVKVIEVVRFREEREGKKRKKTIREHDRKYHW